MPYNLNEKHKYQTFTIIEYNTAQYLEVIYKVLAKMPSIQTKRKAEVLASKQAAGSIPTASSSETPADNLSDGNGWQ